MADEKKLNTIRTSAKRGLTRIEKYVNDFKAETMDLDELSVRNTKLEDIWNNYDSAQTELEFIDEDKYEADRDVFESQYYSVKASIYRINKEGNIPSTTVRTNQTYANNKLPQINLPTFSGNYEQWPSFYDIFKAMIHDNSHITDIQKFYYLKSALRDEAARVIQEMTVTSENYNPALELLKERYDNKIHIANAHLKALHDLPNVGKDISSGLRKISIQTKQHIQALQSLGLPIKHWDVIIIFIISSKLDNYSRREWEITKTTKQFPTLEQFLSFLDKRSNSFEIISSSERSFEKPRVKATHLTSGMSAQFANCIFCKGNHYMMNCEDFMKKNCHERLAHVKSLNLCINCLKRGHTVSNCISRNTCKRCSKKHNTLLHNDNYQVYKQQQDDRTIQQKSNNQPEVTLHNIERDQSQILLATAIVFIKDNQGRWQKCRALLDSAAQSNFATTSLVNRLKIKSTKSYVPINGINQTRTNINRSAILEIKSTRYQYQEKLEFLILDNITINLPVQDIQQDILKLPNIQLADPYFGKSREIDLLIGAEVYFDLLEQQQIKLGKGLPVLQKTKLGWLVSGKCKTESKPIISSCHLSITNDISQQIAKFWELEEYPEVLHYSIEEQICEKHFKEHVRRDDTGRFIVKLPFRDGAPNLGDSYENALRRFKQLEKRLQQQDSLRIQYHNFMNEYIQLNHMILEPNPQRDNGYYLPHHAVVKSSRLSTKLRVVFNASAKTSNGKSLNDELMIGPILQNDIFTILLRFRMHKFVLTADIEKMYRQFRVHPEDIKYQRILWRSSQEQPIQTYNLTTVTYGTAPGSFLAVRCLHQLATEEAHNYPLASEAVKRDFYVDDLMTGTDTFEEASNLRDQLISMLNKGGLILRKWLSNDKALINDLKDNSDDPLISLDTSTTVKTLGIQWNADLDTIHYETGTNEMTVAITKRQILSHIAKIFDPLGLVSPIIIQAKIIMQQLWDLKADWDQLVPSTISHTWYVYQNHLSSIKNLAIPRRIFIDNTIDKQMHGFCDASEKAYGACIYIRSTNQSNNHEVKLICSKTKVAPIKKISLPRLELCAALLLAKLYNAVNNAIKLKVSKTLFWSDSTITLHWINTSPNLLKTFVANRVAKIQNITHPNSWYHINTFDNPADIASRGQLPSQLINNSLWWNGPSWLNKDENLWPKRDFDSKTIIGDTEMKPKQVTLQSMSQGFDLFYKFSSLIKLQRVVAYCFRFVRNIRWPCEKQEKTSLTVTELDNSLKFLIRTAQAEVYMQEIINLEHGKPSPLSSQLQSLYPFLDEDHIMRVTGRLQNSDLSYARKHQIILPPKHIITKLIIQQEHLRLLHGGILTTINSIRQKYWPINVRSLTRQIIHKCLKCYRLRASTQQQIMGNLPIERVKMTKPFQNCGVDYGGPINIKKTRNITEKAYIALFICMATKAIHLELVTSLSTDAFLGALRRFISRRGICLNIYSDNGTNFQGAANELKRFFRNSYHQQIIADSVSKEGIQWHFIPPGAPHFGGLWESGIKSAKVHMQRVIGEAKLNYEELYTLLTQIEACLNSRPLTPLNDEPSGLDVLTPAHFLIGEPLTLLPEPNTTNIPINRLSRWQLVKQQLENFWKRWSHEYLHNLQQRNKWTHGRENLQMNQMVLIKEENIHPLQWKIGRIINVHPGSDHQVRVVTVKTSTGELKRPITKLCLLPIDVET